MKRLLDPSLGRFFSRVGLLRGKLAVVLCSPAPEE